MKTVGLLINPVAGLGGRVGLKGSDGVAQEALARGAIPQANQKAELALANLSELRSNVNWITCAGAMGEQALAAMDFPVQSLWRPTHDQPTTAKDTQAAARWMLEQKLDLLLFVGGDGTARDLCSVVEGHVVALGIPAGVKVHSPVYAKTPTRAGTLAALYLSSSGCTVSEAEVLDLDEEAYREDVVRTRLFGYLRVPVHNRLMQSKKAPTPLSDRQSQLAIAQAFIDKMETEVCYIIGPGTTTQAVTDLLGLKGTLLGVDVVQNKKLVQSDVGESVLLKICEAVQGRVALVLTPTGGQGYLLGRGNQQISSKVLKWIEKSSLHVLCTKQKLADLKGQPLMLDTGDVHTDLRLKGYIKVLTGYDEMAMYKLEC